MFLDVLFVFPEENSNVFGVTNFDNRALLSPSEEISLLFLRPPSALLKPDKRPNDYRPARSFLWIQEALSKRCSFSSV